MGEGLTKSALFDGRREGFVVSGVSESLLTLLKDDVTGRNGKTGAQEKTVSYEVSAYLVSCNCLPEPKGTRQLVPFHGHHVKSLVPDN